MSVGSVTDNSAANSATTTKTTSSTTGFSKTDFLKILTTQLKYQDPMDPAKAQDFMSQLAQLTSVESLQNIQSSLDSLVTKTGANQWIAAIGKRMEVQDTVMSPGDQLVLSPSQDFDTIKLTLLNNEDGTTETKTFGPSDSLVVSNEDKYYTIKGLTATKDGQEVECNVNLYRVIRGIQTTDSGTVLVAGDGKTYDTAKVTAITQ
jgi:flagellar hook assembly protein FlgD